MRHVRAYGVAGLAALAIAAVAVAQTRPAAPTAQPAAAPAAETAPAAAPATQDPKALDALATTHWGDPKAGATKAGACAACHGLDGNSTDPKTYPRLAGQSERFIAKELAMFKAGLRTTGMASIMVPYASALNPQDMRDVGAYFATQHSGAGVADDAVITDANSAYKGQKFYEPGQKLYHQGDASRGIVACMACHGPDGSGNPGPAFPHIGGQQSWYVTRRLTEYRAGVSPVKDDKLFAAMALETKSLTDEEIQSLGAYVQGLHNRADEAGAADTAKTQAPAAAAPATPAN